MSQTSSPPWPLPFWIAHRGAGKLAPENTLAAFRLGAAHGYRAFECDVKLSADEVPFLLHDATLDRTACPASGLASARDWQDLSRLDAGSWHSPAYAGEPPASLDAVARFVLRNDFALDLEIKPTPGHEARTGQVVAAEACRLWAASPRPPLLSSFSVESLRAALATAPHLPRALLLDALAPDWLGTATELRCVAVIAQHRLLDAAVVEPLHAAGLRALAYTVNEGDEAERLLALGVDGLITDRVDTFPPAVATP